MPHSLAFFSCQPLQRPGSLKRNAPTGSSPPCRHGKTTTAQPEQVDTRWNHAGSEASGRKMINGPPADVNARLRAHAAGAAGPPSFGYSVIQTKVSPLLASSQRGCCDISL
ncbi:hypothetical protein EYF80_006745 [Liparis tanakae]|uniref:Uncharacterized protein n=1 Tax=Liparis tanakae TaxID=230148 RepID=A0A4Z2J0E2_9TELE|nr:hypothetical protein EYF80_006745 [Liparis tanakae]